MLNHKFYLDGADENDMARYIRISDTFIEKMKPDLSQYKFLWNGYECPQYGLSHDFTIIKLEELKQLKACVLNYSEQSKEKNKLNTLIDKAIEEKKELIHKSPDCMPHDFVICTEFPDEINYNNYKNEFIKIPDQFIMENYNVFNKVSLYWGSTKEKGNGFNYYGVTLISSKMAQELIDTMENYLKNNTSEQALYFVGREYSILLDILIKAVEEEKVILHFGI